MTPFEMNQLYEKSVNYILPSIFLQGRENVTPNEDSLKKGIQGLEELNAEYAKSGKASWACLWLLGKANQAMGNLQEAYDKFLMAHKLWDSDDVDVEITQGHADVVRELALSCLQLKKFKDGVYYAYLAMQFDIEDYSLWANYAVSLLMNGDINGAETWGKKTLEKWEDPSTKSLLEMIGEIREGKRTLPQDISEL